MTQPETMPAFPGWKTVEKLGEGGMCAVYRVRPDGQDGPERAIKMLQDSTRAAAQRFTAEARLLTRIDHPNVLRVYSLHDETSPPWIVMDLLAGRDLEETRIEQGPMDPEQAARIFADLAAGMSMVHELGVRHRDIKPANLMMGHDGVVRVIDFGIARDTQVAHKTREGLVVGTASYLPPEIFNSKESTLDVQDTVAADVYALAQSMLEVVCGVALHERETQLTGAAMLVQIMQDKLERDHLDPREWRPAVPEGLAEIIMRATTQDPADRTPSMRQLENELRAWLARRRSAGEQAPLTAVDPSALPPPPAHTGPPVAVPKREPVHETTSSAPVSARAAGAAAASALVLLVLVGGLGLLLVAGIAAVYFFAPAAPPAPDEDQRASLQQTLDGLDGALAGCIHNDATGQLVVRARIHEQALSDTRIVRSTLDDGDLQQCLVDRLVAARWAEGPDHVVDIPLYLEP